MNAGPWTSLAMRWKHFHKKVWQIWSNDFDKKSSGMFLHFLKWIISKFQEVRSCAANENQNKNMSCFLWDFFDCQVTKNWCTRWTLGKALDFVKNIPKVILAIHVSDQNQEKDVKLLDSSMIFLEKLWQEKNPTHKESAPKSKNWYHWCTMLGFIKLLGSLDARTKNNGNSWRCNTRSDIDLLSTKMVEIEEIQENMWHSTTHAIHGAGIFYPKDKPFIEPMPSMGLVAFTLKINDSFS